MSLKRWTQIYKALGNINRLKIIKLLSEGQPMTVADIAKDIDISFKATSKHLILLHNLDVLTGQGRDGHVYYDFNRDLPKDLQKTLEVFFKIF